MRFLLHDTGRPSGRRTALVWAVLMALVAASAWSQPLSSKYQFSVSNAPYTPISGGTIAIVGSDGTTGVGAYNEDATAGPYDIGFDFNFNGTIYQKFTLNTRGVLVLGTNLANPKNNAIEAPPPPLTDIIAPMWDQSHMFNGSAVAGGLCVPPGNPHVSFVVMGEAPNRVLVAEWATQLISSGDGLYYYTNANGCATMMNFQARLYEGSNKIEFDYGWFRWSSTATVIGTASIGIASGSGNFLSVTPVGGSSATVDGSFPNNAVNNNNLTSSTLINEGTIYTFTPCAVVMTGLTGPGNGGTPTTSSGDTLLKGMTTQYSSESIFTPFTMGLPAEACPEKGYTLAITGPAAADYILASSGTQDANGSLTFGTSVTPQIIFRPTALGVRNATLTYTDNGGSRTFHLSATATPRVIYTGNTGQGGTDSMKSGDTLLAGRYVLRGTSQTFAPFTVTNTGTGDVYPAPEVTYTITGGDDQYTITPPSATIPNGQSNVPQITFNATGNGPQQATLTVTADGEVRTYTLLAISAYPSANFRIGDDLLDGNSRLFVNTVGCVGKDTASYRIDIENIGGVPFILNSVEAYESDTVYRQGTPRYPLRRDELGERIRAYDYIVSLQPVTPPVSSSSLPTFPIVIPASTTQSVYLTFIGTRPNKRFGRIFFRTNGENFTTIDSNDVPTRGVMSFDLFGRSDAARLSDNQSGSAPKPVIFPMTKVGETSTARLKLVNPGGCELRLSLNDLKIFSGDAKVFGIVSLPTTNIDPVTGDFRLAPHGIDSSIIFSFSPQQAGSQRASVMVRTNDSTIYLPGHSIRGVYYLDLVGSTPTMLATTDADFGAALIGGGPAEHQHNVIHLENTSGFPVQIDTILFSGADSAEFVADGTSGLPVLPRKLLAGERLDLKLVFAPQAGGQSGQRVGEVRLVLSSGDTVVAHLTGFAGTRVLEVTPSALTFAAMSRGKTAHKTLKVANSGTMPMRITGVVLSNSTDFSVSTLARTDLQPGQSEELDVSFKPSATGTSTGTLTITSDAPANGGLVLVTLNGTATKTRGVDPGAISASAIGSLDGELSSEAELDLSISGVDGEVAAGGVALRQSVPNPGRDAVEISYRLADRGEVALALYDGNGRIVRVLDQGVHDRGEHRVTVRVSDLPSGVYHYRLTAGGQVLDRVMSVVK